MMKIKKLIKDLDFEKVVGSKEVEVSGICCNSQLVSPGNIFIAKQGLQVDGNRFVGDAIAAGAVAIVSDFYDPTLKGVTQLIHRQVSKIETILLQRYYENPSRELYMVGVTGTNGKTTTTALIKQLLEAVVFPGKHCGLIGTVEYVIGQMRYQATRTTPEVSQNYKMVREMCRQGCPAAIMEVTSHALCQGRVEGLDFDIALFTNLTVDHLDYHKTMDAYGEAKSHLFKQVGLDKQKKRIGSPRGIVNCDDPAWEKMASECTAPVLTFGIHHPADLMAEEIKYFVDKSSFILRFGEERVPCTLPLPGIYNIYNALGAILVGLSCGGSLQKLAEALPRLVQVSGRLERIENDLGLQIFVDYAHTPDALQNVLQLLSQFVTGQLITVFGCGGNRDQSKRKDMGAIAERYSSFCVLTSDNPREEDPAEICREVSKGFAHPERHKEILDRKEAILKALELANVGDIVLIAGKGHETYQTIGRQTRPFDDRAVAREGCERLVRNP
jgi:UDP-N-acetylmuramoyl-L-alanyl-D-glutamate--2,6-diaminopimelate ligase